VGFEHWVYLSSVRRQAESHEQDGEPLIGAGNARCQRLAILP
jgi:hypothetical protein